VKKRLPFIPVPPVRHSEYPEVDGIKFDTRSKHRKGQTTEEDDDTHSIQESKDGFRTIRVLRDGEGIDDGEKT